MRSSRTVPVIVPVVLLLGVVTFGLAVSEASAQGASWGIKGGVNFATLDSDQDPGPDFTFRYGIVAGGFFTWPLGTRLDVQPELLFSQQGASLDATGVDSATIRLDSFVAPILVRYKLGSSTNGLFVFAGPSIGFNVTAKVTVKSGDNKVTDDIGDTIESVDYGVVFGAGWQSGGRWSIDGRYTWGLSNIGADSDDPEQTRHRVISVLAGVRF